MLMLFPVVNTVPAMPAVSGTGSRPRRRPGHPGEQLVGPLVPEEQGRPFGASIRVASAITRLQQRVEIQLGGDVGHEPQELHLLGPPRRC